MKTILAASVAVGLLAIADVGAAADRVLNVAARETGRVGDFRQRTPNDGAPASASTTAEVEFDGQTLYVTFVCEEDGDAIRAHLSRRDDIAGDDYVAVALDTFQDGRHAYVFKANPLGVQRDGTITEGEDDDYSFDTIWRAEGRVTGSGYTVRFAIPLRSLRYATGASATWGIALTRVIAARAETSTWPHISSSVDAYIPQFARLEGLGDLRSTHHADLTPYGFGSSERVVDPVGSSSATALGQRVGADAKVVIARDWTIDATVHPDFSQIESDEPQVLANQRYEVYFPEKRPFFTDRASFFNTPEPLFFSRRVVDPIAGGRVTGTAGGWTIGTLVAADANHGGEPDAASFVGVARAQRGLRGGSSIGALATVRQNGGASSVVSVDARLNLSPNWVALLQATRTGTAATTGDAQPTSGAGAFAELRHEGLHFKYRTTYRDRSPDFEAPLGFVTRTDIRQVENSASYFFRRSSGRLLAVIPSVSSVVDWNHARELQDASIDAALWFDFTGPVSAAVGRAQAFEAYRGIGFHREAVYVTAYGDVARWLGFSALVRRGTGINFFPALGQAPSLGDAQYDAVDVTLRPSSRWRIAESYVASRLATASSGAGLIADRYLRLKTSVQLSRALSLRAIVDRHALDVDARAVDDTPDRRYTFDLLFTYLVEPGSALYIGFTDRLEDTSVDPALPQELRSLGRVSTGRQIFVKITRSLQF